MVEEFSITESYKSSSFLETGMMFRAVRSRWSGIVTGVEMGLKDC